MLLLLGWAESIGDILQVQGRINLLDGLSEMATISVHLTPALPVAGTNQGGTDIGAEISEAWDSSIEFLTDVSAGVISVVVFAWWVPIAAAPVLLVALRLRPWPQSLDTLE